MVGHGFSSQKAQPSRTQNILRLMVKPPKLWQLLVMLAGVIAAIFWVKYYLPALLMGMK
jgi:hypothetical protein